jgi:hypothetical protein
MSDIKRGRRLPFVILPYEVLDDGTLTPTDILIYVTIARHADSYGQAYPSRARIAKLARCSESTVDRAVAVLKAGRYLDIHRREGTSNLYVIHEVRSAFQGGVITHEEGGSSPMTRGVITGDEGGSSPMTTELDPTNKIQELEGAPSEWTLPAADVKAKIVATLGGKP